MPSPLCRRSWLSIPKGSGREGCSCRLSTKTDGTPRRSGRSVHGGVTLSEELVLDPSPALQRLEQDILHGPGGVGRTRLALEVTRHVTILATTRERLRVDGEHVCPVTPLPADGPGSAAVRLFLDRASAADRATRQETPDTAQVAPLCASLGGLPLAIELAAARLPAAIRSVRPSGSRRRRGADHPGDPAHRDGHGPAGHHHRDRRLPPIRAALDASESALSWAIPATLDIAASLQAAEALRTFSSACGLSTQPGLVVTNEPAVATASAATASRAG